MTDKEHREADDFCHKMAQELAARQYLGALEDKK